MPDIAYMINSGIPIHNGMFVINMRKLGVPMASGDRQINTSILSTSIIDNKFTSRFDDIQYYGLNAANNAPILANALVDQVATVGTAFSYQFASNSFSETDNNDSLTYTATKSDGSALPSWLSFDGSNRTFSGTPTNDDNGTVSIKVTATDIHLASVNDTFDITVSLIAAFKDGVSVGNFPSLTAPWDEISGLTRPTRPENAGILWAISDAGTSPVVMQAYSIGNAASSGIWTLTSSIGADVEDISSASVTGVNYLYISDIGDNAAARTVVNIFRVKEPVVTGSNGTLASGTNYEVIVCNYPSVPSGESNTARRDAETIMADPDTGDMYVLTKRTSAVQAFKLAHAASYSGTQTLTYLGDTFLIPQSNQADGSANGGKAVAGDISPDGREILVKNYTDVYLFKRDKATQSIYQALTGVPTLLKAYVGGGRPSSHPNNEPQGEAITFDTSGVNFYTASEANVLFGSSASAYPLFKYVRLPKQPIVASFIDGISGYVGTRDTYLESAVANQSLVHSGDTTFIADYNTATDERVGLLKFDLTSIPTGVTVIGCDLLLNINTEGSKFRMHRMLRDWAENSTYTSMGGLPLYNDVIAASGADAIHDGYATLTGPFKIKVPISGVQNWIANTGTNFGWAFYNHDIPGGNGFQFRSREHATVSDRPRIEVRYLT